MAPEIEPVSTYLYPILPPPTSAEPINVPMMLPAIPNIMANLAKLSPNALP